eukprot:403331161
MKGLFDNFLLSLAQGPSFLNTHKSRAQCEENTKDQQSDNKKQQKQLTKKQQKALEQAQLQREEQEFLDDQKRKLLSFVRKNTDVNSEIKQGRKEIRKQYDQQAQERKHQLNMIERDQQRQASAVIQVIGKYTMKFLFLKTDDEVLYEYKRKLQKKMQWMMLQVQPFCAGVGLVIYGTLRLIKSKGSLDGMVFLTYYFYSNFCYFSDLHNKLFEIAYPAHPFIFDRRSEVVSRISYFFPTCLRNEIEYLHARIHDLPIDLEAREELLKQDTSDNKYEREFAVGKGKNKYRFKIIVKDAQIYLKCIDKFEDIFELNRDIVKDMELTDILDPHLFDNHKYITDALYEVYRDLGQEYVDKKYHKDSAMELKAKEKIIKKYGLDQQTQKQSSQNLEKNFDKELQQNIDQLEKDINSSSIQEAKRS